MAISMPIICCMEAALSARSTTQPITAKATLRSFIFVFIYEHNESFVCYRRALKKPMSRDVKKKAINRNGQQRPYIREFVEKSRYTSPQALGPGVPRPVSLQSPYSHRTQSTRARSRQYLHYNQSQVPVPGRVQLCTNNHCSTEKTQYRTN